MWKFFRGMSWTQILAGSLAAVTSFVLAAHIGIAGSVIGVAVGSIVSTVASQIYQNVLKESSRKLHDASPSDGGEADHDEERPTAASSEGSGSRGADRGRREADGGDVGADEMPTSSTAGSRIVRSGAAEGVNFAPAGTVDVGGATTRLDAQAAKASTASRASAAPSKGEPTESKDGDAADGTVPDGGGALDPRIVASNPADAAAGPARTRIIRGSSSGRSTTASAKSRAARTRRTAIVVAVVSALVATLLSAGVVLLVTRGRGTDSVVRDMVNSSRSVTPSDDSQPTQGKTSSPSPTASDESPSPTAQESSSSASSSSTSSSSSSASPSSSSTGQGTASDGQSSSPSASASASSSASPSSSSSASSSASQGQTAESSPTATSTTGSAKD